MGGVHAIVVTCNRIYVGVLEKDRDNTVEAQAGRHVKRRALLEHGRINITAAAQEDADTVLILWWKEGISGEEERGREDKRRMRRGKER